MTDRIAEPTPAWLTWTERGIAAAGLLVVAWAMATASGGVIHGHPAYAILLAITVVVSSVIIALSFTRRTSRRGWRRALRVATAILAIVWVGLMVWLRPFTAVEPAIAAMASDSAVTVTETPTQIVMRPAGDASPIALQFQPGARVDPRAYAAVLRPLAEAGHPVVITKQPLGIGFLAMGGLDQARQSVTGVTFWVVGGHSLGGTVAAFTAANSEPGDVDGLLLFASYPAEDMTDFGGSVLSISGSLDGLSTPANIDASRADLPELSTFTVIDGAVHAQFGSYGPQPGDGTPTISDDDARAQITAASLTFLGPRD